MTHERTQHGLTVGAVADAAGVTVRTLHHWDAIGLLSPSGRTSSGYRLYTQSDVDRIDRVIAYRESGLRLDAIRSVLDDPTQPVAATLAEQRDQLRKRIRHLQQLDERLDRMIRAHESGVLLSESEQTETFGPDWDPARTAEAQKRWGSTDQWAQFAERSASRSREDWEHLSAELREVDSELAAAKRRGVKPGSDDAEALVHRHRTTFSRFFTLTREMQVCLARRYESDPEFAAHYEALAPGLATWFRRLVDESARRAGIDPDTAQWR